MLAQTSRHRFFPGWQLFISLWCPERIAIIAAFWYNVGMARKRALTVRLSDRAWAMLDALYDALIPNQAAIIELALREFAKKHNIALSKDEDGDHTSPRKRGIR
jgi:hypothetical protein